MNEPFSGDNIPQFNLGTSESEQDLAILTDRYGDVRLLESQNTINKYAALDKRSGSEVEVWFAAENAIPNRVDEKDKTRIETLCSLSHKHIIPITDYDLSENYLWVEAQHSFRPIRDTVRQLPLKDIKRLINQLFELAAYVNEYTVLGQLSLDDLYVDDKNSIMLSLNGQMLSILFGVKSGVVAPEQKSSRNYQSKTADQFIVASLVTQLLSQQPYKNRKNVDAIFNKATNPDPLKRFKDMNALLQTFDENFKCSWTEQWLTPKYVLSCSLLALLTVSIFMFQQTISDFVDEVMPKSKEEITQLNQQASTLSSKLLNQLSEYEKQRRMLVNEQQQLIKQSGSTLSDKLRLAALGNIITLLDSQLSEKDITDVKSKVKGIDVLIKEQEFEIAIKQLQSLESQIQEAYGIALFGPDAMHGYLQLNRLEERYAEISKDPFVSENLDNIAISVKSVNFENLLEESITPLIEYYQSEKQRLYTDKVSSLLNDLNSTMVSVPGGQFEMGVRKAGMVDAKPMRNVSIRPFEVSKFELTYGIYNQYLQLTAKPVTASNSDAPVANISWFEVSTFINWLNKQSNKKYRLLSEAEWEYLAKSGHKSLFFWGNSVSKNHANCADCLSNANPSTPSSVGAFNPNPYGVYDLNGNLWEWTQDCYARNYRGAPRDGTAVEFADCQRRVIRGGAWNSKSRELHPAYRNASKPDYFSASIGVRLAR